MTPRDEIPTILDDWFVAGPTEISDRALDAALDVIDHTAQRRVLRLPWWTGARTFSLRVAVATLVAVVVVGGLLIFRVPATNVGQPSPSSPSTTATPTPIPSTPTYTEPPEATAPIAGTVLAQGQMALAPGTTYSTLSFAPSFSIRGAASWWLMGDGPGHVWLDNGPNEPHPPDQYTFGMVVVSKVLPVGGGSAIAAPADLVGWLRSRSDVALGSPRPITVGGLRGTAVVGTVRSGAKTNTGGAINLICSADFLCGQERGDEIGVGPGRAFEIIVIPFKGQSLVIEADGMNATWSANAPTIDALLAGLSFPSVPN